MVVFPNAKINIGLRVLNKRKDGYHNIESGIFPLGWKDILEINTSMNESTIQCSGIEIKGSREQNLVWKTYKLLQNRYDVPPVNIFLYKNIPLSAGLGGGSSDAAFTILAINKLFDLNLENGVMESLAAEIGSDCPFFINNKPYFATQTGTTLSLLPSSRKKWIQVVCPDITVSTKDAYSNLIPGGVKDPNFVEILSSPVHSWREKIVNDFETSVFGKHPEISKLKKAMYDAGAGYASMSGSGSSVFGIFDTPQTIEFGPLPSWSGQIIV